MQRDPPPPATPPPPPRSAFSYQNPPRFCCSGTPPLPFPEPTCSGGQGAPWAAGRRPRAAGRGAPPPRQSTALPLRWRTSIPTPQSMYGTPWGGWLLKWLPARQQGPRPAPPPPRQSAVLTPPCRASIPTPTVQMQCNGSSRGAWWLSPPPPAAPPPPRARLYSASMCHVNAPPCSAVRPLGQVHPQPTSPPACGRDAHVDRTGQEGGVRHGGRRREPRGGLHSERPQAGRPWRYAEGTRDARLRGISSCRSQSQIRRPASTTGGKVLALGNRGQVKRRVHARTAARPHARTRHVPPSPPPTAFSRDCASCRTSQIRSGFFPPPKSRCGNFFQPCPFGHPRYI
jgi:hypothetical protein